MVDQTYSGPAFDQIPICKSWVSSARVLNVQSSYHRLLGLLYSIVGGLDQWLYYVVMRYLKMVQYSAG